MNFSSLLSDHEQKAFSAFLGQLAQENRYKTHSPPSVDLTIPQHHLQQPLHQRSHLQPSSSLGSSDFSRALPSIADPSSLSAQQQRDWIQHVSSNPLLAPGPGGINDLQAMSQAFLQNPDLMAQANAITQAMVLAQQQQMQLQLQQHQQLQQEQTMLQHGLHGSHPHSMLHHYNQGSPPGGSYSSDQQQQYYPRTITKRTSQTNLHGGSDHDLSPPPLPSNGIVPQSGPRSFSSSPKGYYEAGYAVHPHYQSQENDDDDYGPPTKKSTGRKGSSANDSQRSSRDGYETQRTEPRRKTSGSAPYDSNGRRDDYYVDNREDSEESSFPGPILEHRNGLNKMGEGDAMRQRQSSASDNNASRSRSSKKAPHELLTDAEKKANHIASEQKRRQNIRIGFDSLVEIVPTLSECHRSEALILQKSVDYIHRLLGQKHELKSRVRDLQANLGDPEDEDSASDMEIEMYH
ncbi:hypothetical protein BGZ99_008074 [Dissophora globulifera]|uniref:BHLH domain-containing protein n=1 Tax=Dissophora globulifera TaxID=979702 RepID=A0A9P6UPV6_9FUNG|nr:hypothetical protein BGZ99_008074 [Dissophora globulifera]